jgi:hypothetical protein
MSQRPYDPNAAANPQPLPTAFPVVPAATAAQADCL